MARKKRVARVAGDVGMWGCCPVFFGLMISVSSQQCSKLWLGTFKVYRWMWSPTRILGRDGIFPGSRGKKVSTMKNDRR